jgi:fused signal recognition particle receptor
MFFRKPPSSPTAPTTVPESPPPESTSKAPEGATNWLSRLKSGLGRSSVKLVSGIAAIFTHRKLDSAMLEALEELLISADLGPNTAAKLVEELRQERFGKEISDIEVRQFLAERLTTRLLPIAKPLLFPDLPHPHVVLMVGVNGTGKTTTIGKLAWQWQKEGHKVMVAAGDTFRAAAVEQLQIWAERAHVPILTAAPGSDAAALAYQALEHAQKTGIERLLIDTAGRLHNRQELMAELAKIVRVLKKRDPNAPHATLLTLDATTGQNAHAQVEIFRQIVAVDGLVLTKLDGSAKGGVLLSLAEKFSLPVPFIGIGEGAGDLRPFKAHDFAQSLMGLGEAPSAPT